MKTRILLSLLVFAQLAFAKINAIVSIVPQKSFVEAIGGDLINLEVMVAPGSSPHSYEPKPSQMKAIAQANLYFTIGVEFESAWMKRFSDQNKNMKIIDSTKNIKKIAMKEHNHHEEKAHAGDKHSGLDPHIWTSPANIKIIAKNILDALIANDATHKITYETNYKNLISKIDETDKQIKEVLKNTKKGAKFMVFHPAWGYFAHQYGLAQMAIEVEGKEPKPKELAMILEEAKEEKVKAIFTQPEFSDKSANLIANELKIKVIKTSPLNPDWSTNFINMAKAIANQ